MNFGQYLAALAAAWAAFESGSPESFKVGSVTVTAKVDKTSNHLTIGQLAAAALLALEGQTGVVQVGSVEFDITG
jgi:hypothetical protein